MIKLNDILHLTQDQISIAKVKFNRYNGWEDPIEIYKSNPDLVNKSWLYWRTKNRYFDVGQIAICLVKIRGDLWLLTTIDTVDKELNVKNGINYIGTPLEQFKSFFGRTVIRFHKSFQTQGVNFETVSEGLEVCQILPEAFDDDDFPGYDKVRLSYCQLKSILNRGKKDWVAALENQKAVYLITDTQNGKLYVGSATSEKGMLLQRWNDYVTTGHGGNKELIRIVETKGIEYIQTHFQYSILENYNAKIDDSIILEREKWWKKTLLSHKFGYNDNL